MTTVDKYVLADTNRPTTYKSLKDVARTLLMSGFYAQIISTEDKVLDFRKPLGEANEILVFKDEVKGQ